MNCKFFLSHRTHVSHIVHAFVVFFFTSVYESITAIPLSRKTHWQHITDWIQSVDYIYEVERILAVSICHICFCIKRADARIYHTFGESNEIASEAVVDQRVSKWQKEGEKTAKRSRLRIGFYGMVGSGFYMGDPKPIVDELCHTRMGVRVTNLVWTVSYVCLKRRRPDTLPVSVIRFGQILREPFLQNSNAINTIRFSPIHCSVDFLGAFSSICRFGYDLTTS